MKFGCHSGGGSLQRSATPISKSGLHQTKSGGGTSLSFGYSGVKRSEHANQE